MDFYFDGQLSTSSPSAANEETQMRGGVSQEFSREMSVNRNQEQQSSCYSSIINNISSRAQDLVEKINDRRAKDLTELESFQEQLVDKVNEMCRQMKENMYAAYEHNSDEMQVKLQELSEVLERCTKCNSDLTEARRSLSCLNEGLAIAQSSE
uniref:Synaptonemal complex central element protein 2 n=1 Tax=Gouania willdenowi TaxID=441366 RepID=A0A8C5G0D6_GOUWI